MIFTKDQAQWLVGAIDLRLKNDGLNSAAMALMVTQAINTDQAPPAPPGSGSTLEDKGKKDGNSDKRPGV